MVFLAIALGAVVTMIVGSLWYSPALFGKAWMRLSGIEMDKSQVQGMGKIYFGAFLNSLIMSAVLFYLIRMTQAHTWEKAYPVAFVVWLGFGTVLFGGVLWEKKPLALYWIHSLYYLVSLTAVLTVFLLFKIA